MSMNGPCRVAGAVVACLALLMTGCGLETEADFPNQDRQRPGTIVYDSELKENPEDSLFGDGGLDLFNLGGSNKKVQPGSGIAVNSFLWRASLDTVAFMPLTSADPFGGVIITDWYSPPETPSERYKMSVYILGRQLRADGVRVAVFRQETKGPNVWLSKAVSETTATNLENKILTRARQLRLASEKN